MRGWKRTQETFPVWPFKVSISQCLFPESLHNLIVLSSAAEARIFMVGWNETQLTPFS